MRCDDLKSASQRLFDFWREFDAACAPFVHPADAALVEGELGLQTDYLPEPFMGDPSTADVILLMGNPGNADPSTRDGPLPNALRLLMRRETSPEWRFPYLHRSLASSAGGIYWRKKLNDLREELHPHRSIDVGFELLGTRLAVMQSSPYHSKARPSDRFVRRLPSAEVSRCFIQAAERAARKKCVTLVVVRGLKLAQLPCAASGEAIVYYDPMRESLPAYVGRQSRAWRPILRQLMPGARKCHD